MNEPYRVAAGSSRRRSALAGAVLAAIVLLPGGAIAQQGGATATYTLRILRTDPPRIGVHAVLPSVGAEITMARSRPGDVPEVADAGWPALVRGLVVKDPDGLAVGVTSAGAAGWRLARPVDGSLTLDYEVDTAPLAARGWPAPREAAFADSEHIVMIGRSLFIATPAQRSSEIHFELPPGWRAVVPWSVTRAEGRSASASSSDDLSENLVAFSRGEPEVMTAGGFNLKVVTFGYWRPARNEIRRVLGIALEQLVGLIGFEGDADYLVVLLPQLDRGADSFRASFALTLDQTPSSANLGSWGNLIAHEVFHYWNGWRLHGSDYQGSQWFQEGITEYAANLAMIKGGVDRPDEFYARIAAHVDNYRKLETPLDAPGTRKGPPLYSGGALVAFIWDTMILESSGGGLGVGDALRALLRDTEGGARPYAWPDIKAALERVAPGDWEGFHGRHIHGTDPLPVGEALARVGLLLVKQDDGSTRVDEDPAASGPAAALRRSLMTRRK